MGVERQAVAPELVDQLGLHQEELTQIILRVDDLNVTGTNGILHVLPLIHDTIVRIRTLVVGLFLAVRLLIVVTIAIDAGDGGLQHRARGTVAHRSGAVEAFLQQI